jgi:hypothetical protein
LNTGVTEHQPILFVDVDGVISLFGFREPYGLASGNAPSDDRPSGTLHNVNGIPHYIKDSAGAHLRALSAHFELVWATGWEETANEHLPHILDLGRELPFLTFDGRVAAGACHWKIEAIEEYAGRRPVSWIDDNFDQSCYDWAERRAARTLLIETERHVGMHDAHCEQLINFATEPSSFTELP